MSREIPSSTAEKGAAWRAIGLFLSFLFLFSSVFYFLMGYRGQMTLLTVTGIMWCPALAALLVCKIMKRSIHTLPWRWGAWKWNQRAYFLPLGYGLAIYLPVWIFSLGGSGFGNPETLANWSASIIGESETNLWAASLGLFLLATFGLVGVASRALGEEIGWRGFLIWEMRKVMPFWALGLASGAIWAIWHFPAMLMADYNAGDGNIYLQMFMFLLGIAPMGIIYAYFTFRAESLWPAVILHASHNLFLQKVFTPLTTQGENSSLYIDEFGVLLPLTSILLAILFLYRAHREGLTAPASAAKRETRTRGAIPIA